MNTNAAEAGTLVVPDNTVRTRIVRWGLFLFMAWVVSGLVLNATLTSGDFHQQDYRTDFGDMVYGEAHRPFVARAAPFAVVRAASNLTPSVLKQKIHSYWTSHDVETWTGFSVESSTEGLWALLLMHLCVVGFILGVRELQRELFDLDEFTASCIALFAGACLPVLRPFFLYDYAVVCLFTLCLLLMVRSQWPLFYLAFVVLCLTKETAVLLPFLLLLLVPRLESRKKALGHVVLQGVIWAVAFIGLRWVFRGNPGAILEFHLLDHNPWVLTQWEPLIRTTRYLIPDRSNLMLLAVIGALVFHRFADKPVFLRRALVMTVPLILLLAVFGYIDEMRTYYEVFPVFFLLMQYSVMKLFGYRFEPNRDLLPSFK